MTCDLAAAEHCTAALCRNVNHLLRRYAPVGHCPDCGAVVNARVAAVVACDEEKHAAARHCTHFSVDCGAQLAS